METDKGKTEQWIDELLLAALIKQYKQFGSLLIAFDFDDTVSMFSVSEGYKRLHMINRALTALRFATKQGHKMICYTANPNVEHIKTYCKFNNIQIDYLNRSPVESGGGKIYYNIFLDDKCGLKSATDTLLAALVKIQDLKASDSDD